MSADVVIADAPPGEREGLGSILGESFEGLYLWHAKKTLREIELVRVARIGGEYAGLAMLKKLGDGVGYIYYVAVARNHRRKGVGRRLLTDALDYFSRLGLKEAYASIEEDNAESRTLFASQGFRETTYDELSRKYGRIHALEMYRKMLVVPGETLFCKELG